MFQANCLQLVVRLRLVLRWVVVRLSLVRQDQQGTKVDRKSVV
jgi:hypothetical protein